MRCRRCGLLFGYNLAGEHLMGVHGELAVLAVHGEGVAGGHLVGNDLAADEGLHRVLHEAAQGTGAVYGVVGAVDDEVLGGLGSAPQ